MIEPADIERKTRKLEALFAKHLGLSSGPLARRNLRARRLLPARVRADIETVLAAGQMAGHPKLARQMDRGPVEEAYARAEAHLRSVSRFDLIWGRVLSVLGSMALGLISAFVLFLSLLIWRGFL